jgi:hypothetical protein
MTTNDRTDSSVTPANASGNASAKTETTASAKAAARNKKQQQKNQKLNPQTTKKKQTQPQTVKSIFDGIASGVSPMKGIVIAQGSGNLAGKFCVFQKKLAGAAANDKAYGLDSSILDLVAKVKSDFVKPKPDPRVHSKIVVIMEKDDKGIATTTPTSEKKLICFDPFLKDEMEAEYSMDLNKIPVMAPILAPILGVYFFRGISPSKIEHIAPFLATIQRLSKTRVFLHT